MITLLVGAPGHGKSYTMTVLFDKAVREGKPVATNLPLAPEWPMVLAKRHTLFGFIRKEAVARRAARYETMVFVSEDLEELTKVRLSGEGESRGLMLIDEAHRKLNTRTLSAQLDGDGKPLKRAVAIAARMRIIAHLSGHRHYGFDITLATQAQKNLDGQAASLYEFVAEVRNFKRLPMIGAILKMNIFLRVTRWNDRARTKAGVSLYFLSKSLARLYQTHALQHLDWPVDAIVLHPKGIPSTVGIPSREDQNAATNDIDSVVDRVPGALEVPLPHPTNVHDDLASDLLSSYTESNDSSIDKGVDNGSETG